MFAQRLGENRRTGTAILACATALAIGASAAHAAEVSLFEAWRDTGNYRVYVDGLGLHDDSGTGTFQDVLVGGPVAKAYLYWIGANTPATDTATDPTVTLTRQGAAGAPVNADATYVVPFENPNAPGSYYWNANHSVFVADVTQLIMEGNYDYTVSDFDMDQEYGVGLQIVYQDDNAALTDVAIHQGHDYAFANWVGGGELNRTDVVTHTFDPAPFTRVLEVTFFVGGGEHSNRPDQLWMLTGTSDGRDPLPTELITNNLGDVIDPNPIEAEQNEEWDTIVKKIVIEPGQNYAAFQFQSGGGTGQGLPESFSWISATFAMRAVPEPATALLLGAGALVVCRRRRRC
ncbi:MAG: PEP-CTERM sorting domain-containing protein [Phycisphaerales bacterium]|nr:PEP-CTERM sorting domain-containing protein [Phycisphaerales bacterium]